MKQLVADIEQQCQTPCSVLVLQTLPAAQVRG